MIYVKKSINNKKQSRFLKVRLRNKKKKSRNNQKKLNISKRFKHNMDP